MRSKERCPELPLSTPCSPLQPLAPYPKSSARLTGFVQIGDYTLRLRFNDDCSFQINFLSGLIGRSLAPLREKAVFATVRLDPWRGALVWANGTEMDSATLRAWRRGFPHQSIGGW